jgi:hypothetical protein
MTYDADAPTVGYSASEKFEIIELVVLNAAPNKPASTGGFRLVRAIAPRFFLAFAPPASQSTLSRLRKRTKLAA